MQETARVDVHAEPVQKLNQYQPHEQAAGYAPRHENESAHHGCLRAAAQSTVCVTVIVSSPRVSGSMVGRALRFAIVALA